MPGRSFSAGPDGVKRPLAWDCVVVGGGPAGLSAAVYMGRFLRRTLVLDDGHGRWSYGQTNENYLGFPRGVSARRLRSLGQAQARRFGAQLRNATVTGVVLERGGTFLVNTPRGEMRTRTVIWAAGVEDEWPDFVAARTLVGTRLFWCIVCDGWRTLDKDILLFGRDDSAARTALQFLTYTRRLTFVIDPRRPRVTAWAKAKLEAEGIRVVVGSVRSCRAEGERVELCVADERPARYDYLFSLLGSRPRVAALAGLPLKLSRKGHVAVDDKNRTSLAGFFAAGDVTDKHSHQVVSAVHEGAQAAQAANHVLYPPAQKLGR
jgi:thioredoxin reductase (NADPH)